MRILASLLFLLSFSLSAQTVLTTTANQTITGVKTFSGSNKLCLKDPGDADLACIVAQAISGAQTITLPAVTGTLATLAGTETLTNKSIVATQLTGTIDCARLPALTGDVTTSGCAATVATLVGDSGSGGTKGLVPAPGSGDAAANKYLKADGTWATVAGASAGGSDTQVQYNSSSALAGSANMTFDGTKLTVAGLKDSALTSGRVTYATTSGELTDSNQLTFDGTLLTAAQIRPANVSNGHIIYGNTSGAMTGNASLTWDGSKLNIPSVAISGLTSGRIPYAGGSGVLADSSSLQWDNSNARFGVGGTPSAKIHAQGTAAAGGGVSVFAENSSTAGYTGMTHRINGAEQANWNTTGSTFSTSGIFAASSTYLYGVASATYVGHFASGPLILATGGAATANERMRILSGGQVAISGGATPLTAPTAKLHIAAGSATANTAPLKLTSGTNLSTAETGAFEYNGTNLFFTRTGTTRENIITSSAVSSVSATSPNRTITVVIDGTTYYIHAKTTND